MPLSAGDLELAVQLIEAGLPDALNREDRPTLERWLSLLPAAFVEQQPVLLMLKVWVLQFSWQLGDQLGVAQPDRGIDRPGRQRSHSRPTPYDLLRAQIALLRGQEAYFRNQPSLALAQLDHSLTPAARNLDLSARRRVAVPGMSMQADGQAAAPTPVARRVRAAQQQSGRLRLASAAVALLQLPRPGQSRASMADCQPRCCTWRAPTAG